jgi:hypothetical protein
VAVAPSDATAGVVTPEQSLWIAVLGSSLLLAAVSMALVFATNIAWFVVGAVLFGPWATITGLVYLTLSSDRNTPTLTRTPEA